MSSISKAAQEIPIVKQILDSMEKAGKDTAQVIVVNQVKPSKPQNATKTLTGADTEYEIAMPVGTKKFAINMRSTSYAWRYAWQEGRVASSVEPYNTVPAAGTYYEDDVDTALGTKLYVACATAAQVLECVFWV